MLSWSVANADLAQYARAMGSRMRLLALVALIGCDCGAPQTTDGEEGTGASMAPVGGEEPPTESTAAEPVLRTDIGWETLPADADRRARAINRRALRTHRDGDYDESAAGFREALEIAPTYLMARFNLACALARTEAFDDAATEMEELFLRDLPTFGPRLESDEDLAALAASERGAELRSFREHVERSYRAVMGRGVWLVSRTLRPAADYHPDERHFRGTAFIQPGVWLSEDGRFVPMSPRASAVDEPSISWPVVEIDVDRERGLVAIATADKRATDSENLVNVRIVAYEVPGGRLLGEARPRDTEDQPIFRVSVETTATGASWSATHHSGHLGPAPPEEQPATASSESGTSTRPRFVFERNRTMVLGEGDDAQRIELPREHRTARATGDQPNVATWGVPLGDGHALVMTTSSAWAGFDGLARGSLALSQVDLGAGTAELVLSDSGFGAMRSGPDDDVFVQINETLRRYTLGEEPQLLEGLLLEIDSE